MPEAKSDLQAAEDRLTGLIQDFRNEVQDFRNEVREDMQALRRGVEFIGERLFGDQGRPEFQSRGELDELNSRMRKVR